MICYQLTDCQIARCRSAAKQVTERRSRFSKGKGSQWHQGQFGTPDVSTRVGFFGEIALHEIISVWFKSIPVPNIDPVKKVQRYDFDWKTPVGQKHEVKTTVAEAESERNYVREKAVESADTFWFLSTPDTENGLVYLRGWCRRDELLERSVKAKGKGNWENLLIETESLNSIKDFLDMRKSK